MMRNSLKYFKPILAGIAVAVILVSVLQFTEFLKTPGMKDSKNPFEYNLDELKEVDQKLLLWNELKPIKIPLVKPSGICIDDYDNLYITGDWSVITYNSSGKNISKFNISHKARCISFGLDNQLYLGMEDHIEIYSTSGNRIAQWAQIDTNTVITSIAISDDFVFVADAGNRVVWKLNHQGEIVSRIGDKNIEQDIPGFIVPSAYFDLSLGYDGKIWVVNPGRHLFQNFTYDGELNSTWGKVSQLIDGFCGCCNPSHFAIMKDGSFITSEKGLPRLKEYSPTGELKSVLAGANDFDNGTVNLDIVVDSKGRVIILDPSRRQLRFFIRK